MPNFIPKKEAKVYRDALIAYHGGKTLGGLFYLRTFIEQFERRQTGWLSERKTGDEIMEEYAKLLPDPPRSQMPSLLDWYDKLSGALHSANADAGLFEKSVADIDRHFDFRRLYGIPELNGWPIA